MSEAEYSTVRDTGIRQWGGKDRRKAVIKQHDERYAEALAAHRHLWIAAVTFYVAAPLQEDQVLDLDNMCTWPAVGCFVCEQEYTRFVSNVCPGEPG